MKWPFLILSPSRGDPREDRCYVAILPIFRPLLILSRCLVLHGDLRQGRGYVAILPKFGVLLFFSLCFTHIA